MKNFIFSSSSLEIEIDILGSGLALELFCCLLHELEAPRKQNISGGRRECLNF